MRRPELWRVGKWTPGEIGCGVQNCGELGNGRQVRLDAASRIVESCGMDATGKCERRPKSQILINRTPGEIGGGVQNCGELGNGRQVRLDAASRMAGRWESDARGMLVWRPNREGGGNRTPFGCECGVQNVGKLWNGRHWDAEVASRMAWCWESDARGMLV
jgi:hypothetical protein